MSRIELLAWKKGRCCSSKPERQQLAQGLEASSIQEKPDTRQGENWKESLNRQSRLQRRDLHNFNHGQRDRLAQKHFHKDQKTRGLSYNIYPSEKPSAFLLPQNRSVCRSDRKICKPQGQSPARAHRQDKHRERKEKKSRAENRNCLCADTTFKDNPFPHRRLSDSVFTIPRFFFPFKQFQDLRQASRLFQKCPLQVQLYLPMIQPHASIGILLFQIIKARTYLL